MNKLSEKATVRRRNADKMTMKYMSLMIAILVFSMLFVFVSMTNKEESMKVAILDSTGAVHKGEVVPFGKAKIYHEYLVNMAVDGLYQRDGEGMLNNYYKIIASPYATNKRNKRVNESAALFREKKIIQTSRILAYKVDKITNLRMDMRVKVQVIKKSYSIGGEPIEGKDMRVLNIQFERNTEMKEGIYRPWILTNFKERKFKDEN